MEAGLNEGWTQHLGGCLIDTIHVLVFLEIALFWFMVMAAKSYFAYFIAKSISYYFCHRTDNIKFHGYSKKEKMCIFDHHGSLLKWSSDPTFRGVPHWHHISKGHSFLRNCNFVIFGNGSQRSFCLFYSQV